MIRVACIAFVLTVWPSFGRAEVDPDCLERESAFLCDAARLADIRTTEELLAPVIEKAGWARACFTVQYTQGDPSAPPTILVSVSGQRGERAPTCRSPLGQSKTKVATAGQLRILLEEALTALRQERADSQTAVRGMKRLLFTNGWGDEAAASLR